MKVTQMFPDAFLKAEHLGGPLLARVESVATESIFVGSGRQAPAWVMKLSPIRGALGDGLLRDKAGRISLILRKTLAAEIARVLGEDDTAAWARREIVLFPTEADGRATLGARLPIPQPAEAAKPAA